MCEEVCIFHSKHETSKREHREGSGINQVVSPVAFSALGAIRALLYYVPYTYYRSRARANARKRNVPIQKRVRSNSRSERFKQSEADRAKLFFFPKTSRVRRPLTFPILSLAGHAHKSTLFPSFCLFLSPHCFHPLVLERRAGNSCFVSFVSTIYDFARDSLLAFSTLLSPLLSRLFSATSCCPAANWNLLSFQSPPRETTRS